jgi:hypothetical protein
LILRYYLRNELRGFDLFLSQDDEIVNMGDHASLVVGIEVCICEEYIADLSKHDIVLVLSIKDMLHQFRDQYLLEVKMPQHILFLIHTEGVLAQGVCDSFEYVNYVIDRSIVLIFVLKLV